MTELLRAREASVHARALPNELPDAALRLRPDARGRVAIDPVRAGWRYLSFDTLRVEAEIRLTAVASEACVVVIAGGDVDVSSGDERWTLPGRPSPFDRLPSALWVPDASDLTLASAAGASVAIARAPRSDRDGISREPLLIREEEVAVEVRGRGNATRQINHIITPDMPADRLEVVEVLTPSGNWSSWPPHKHDVDDMPAETVLEEIYHYRFRPPRGWGIQRVYRADRSRDAMWEVRDGEVVIVPDGYHPFAAAHGIDAYYLNALAGDRRTMACSFDPDLDWVRRTWEAMEPDPRVPLVGGRSQQGTGA